MTVAYTKQLTVSTAVKATYILNQKLLNGLKLLSQPLSTQYTDLNSFHKLPHFIRPPVSPIPASFWLKAPWLTAADK